LSSSWCRARDAEDSADLTGADFFVAEFQYTIMTIHSAAEIQSGDMSAALKDSGFRIAKRTVSAATLPKTTRKNATAERPVSMNVRPKSLMPMAVGCLAAL
jgi:hypothetical protein